MTGSKHVARKNILYNSKSDLHVFNLMLTSILKSVERILFEYIAQIIGLLNTGATIFDTETTFKIIDGENRFKMGYDEFGKSRYRFFANSLGSLPKCL